MTRAVKIDGGEVVAALGITSWTSDESYEVIRHTIVIQYPNGATALAHTGRLRNDVPAEIVRRFDGEGRHDNRVTAVAAMLESAGYGFTRIPDSD